MTYKIQCKSLLLQKALEEFLKDYLSEDGLVISDTSGDIIIGKDIKKPFSKSQLLLQLENVANQKNLYHELKNMLKVKEDIPNDPMISTTGSFEEELDAIILEFSHKLKRLIKKHYLK
ncbi:MAG: hypothetical protein GXO40_05335 [Epsilonproteobacteria bacterium]|nr:hypothetical protein [Campylobacterota bacterium]